MRLVAGLILLLAPALFFLSLVSLVSAQSNSTGLNSTDANATIQADIAYVEQVNSTTFLVFHPNLTQAYLYLNKTMRAYNTSIATPLYYANLAAQSARQAYLRVSSYRYYAAAAMLACTLVVGIVMVLFMRPLRRRKADPATK